MAFALARGKADVNNRLSFSNLKLGLSWASVFLAIVLSSLAKAAKVFIQCQRVSWQQGKVSSDQKVLV